MTAYSVAARMELDNLPVDLNGLYEIRTNKSFTKKEFYAFCHKNPELRIEQDTNGKLIIMAPVGDQGGVREGIAHGELYFWWKITKPGGNVHSPSTGFILPDGSTRSADASWTSQKKLDKLSPEERKKFAKTVPDFVIEVRSQTDSLKRSKKKMIDTWIKNGVRLAWLIDPIKEVAYIYRTDGSTKTIKSFDKVLDGEDVCPDFKLELKLFKDI